MLSPHQQVVQLVCGSDSLDGTAIKMIIEKNGSIYMGYR
jgi:hypothetical protein